MKKRFVLLSMAVAMMISGCQKGEKEAEVVVPPTTEQAVEKTSELPSIRIVQKEETKKAEAGTVETAAEGKQEEPSHAVETVPEVKPEKVSDDGNGNVYKKQMDLVYEALSQKWSMDQYFENEISTLISNHYDGNPLENVGYALEDLDGDGEEELLISAVSKDASGGMLYDVYSAPKGKVVHVLSGHERNRYYLQWLEEGAYMIANEASNSAFNSAWYYYSLSAGRLELMQGIVFNAEADEENPWFITYDEDWDVSNDTHDVDGMAESIIDAYTKSYTTLEYIPFSTY